MSERQRYRKKKDAEQGRAARPRAKSARGKHANLPRQVTPAGNAAPSPILWQAGNAAVTQLLEGRQTLDQQRGGQPLALQTQSEMERAYNTDLSTVRLHNDSSAQAQVEALDAVAFTRGDDIYLGSQSPAPDSHSGRALIAHELAHVIQQRQAPEVAIDRASQPGDAFEQAADQAAQQALQGQSAQVHTGGTAPGVQLEPRPDRLASREEARVALEAFLRRALQEQGGRALRVTPEVRSAVTSLFMGDVGRLMGIDAWLGRPDLPGDPAEFAREVASRLPETIERARIERLNRMAGSAPRPTTVRGRAQEAWERSEPGSPEREELSEASRRARGEAGPPTPRIPAGQVNPPDYLTPQERVERQEQLRRRISGEEEPTQIGPFSVDLLRIGRIVGARREILHGPRTPSQPQPEARAYPEVEQAIQQLLPEALIPAEARGTAAADSFADAREVARDLARRLDQAEQQHQESIELRLGDDYNRVRDRAGMIAEVRRIIQLVRDALPHHSSGVRHIDVYFGGRLVSR